MIPVTVQEKLLLPQLRSLQVFLLSIYCIALLKKKQGLFEKPTTLSVAGLYKYILEFLNNSKSH